MKLIIDIQNGVSPNVALRCVERVINGGRIDDNGESYSRASSFITTEGQVLVFSNKNKKSDKFSVGKIFLD